MKIIFVSGPYSGNPNNSDLSVELCIEVSAAGAMPICPNAFKDKRFMEVRNYDWWILATKKALSRCDGIIFTHNFRESNGATGEEVEAKRLGIPCFYSIEELKSFIQNES